MGSTRQPSTASVAAASSSQTRLPPPVLPPPSASPPLQSLPSRTSAAAASSSPPSLSPSRLHPTASMGQQASEAAWRDVSAAVYQGLDEADLLVADGLLAVERLMADLGRLIDKATTQRRESSKSTARTSLGSRQTTARPRVVAAAYGACTSTSVASRPSGADEAHPSSSVEAAINDVLAAGVEEYGSPGDAGAHRRGYGDEGQHHHHVHQHQHSDASPLDAAIEGLLAAGVHRYADELGLHMHMGAGTAGRGQIGRHGYTRACDVNGDTSGAMASTTYASMPAAQPNGVLAGSSAGSGSTMYSGSFANVNVDHQGQGADQYGRRIRGAFAEDQAASSYASSSSPSLPVTSEYHRTYVIRSERQDHHHQQQQCHEPAAADNGSPDTVGSPHLVEAMAASARLQTSLQRLRALGSRTHAVLGDSQHGYREDGSTDLAAAKRLST